LTLRGYTLFETVKQSDTLARGKQFVEGGQSSGALRPVIGCTFTLDAIVDAHRCMASNRQMGKIALRHDIKFFVGR
jgi:NADPH:quinone reductase-like Zn-dependent oxidoreductase